MTLVRSAQHAVIAAGVLTAGCAAPHRHEHSQDQHGHIVYLDGAGAGSVLTNWGHGVRAGLRQAGYAGSFDNHGWQTGLGVVVDQGASVE